MSKAIRIAIGAPLSGNAAALGAEMKQAIELAVEEQNADGGIAGFPIMVEGADDQGKVETGRQVADDFCNRPDLLGVVGHYNSNVTIAAAEIYAAHDLPMITPIASDTALTERSLPNVFRFTNRDDQTGAAISRHLYDTMGKRRAVLVETETMYGHSIGIAFSRAFLSLGGRIAERRTVREGSRDFDPLVASLRADFDLLFYGGSFEGAFILRAMRRAGLHQLFASGDGCWDAVNFLEPAGETATLGEGVLVLSATPEVGRVAGSSDFAARYATLFGPIGNYAVNSYDSVRVLIAAIRDAITETKGNPSRRDVLTAMRKLRFKGIAYSDPVQWDEKGDNLAVVTALNVVENGRFRQVAEIPRTQGGLIDAASRRPRQFLSR
ncbi:branched-chain amino acid ABC transporter substrate-binding protein [Mesorhizobium sp.]|uniref:branched-chain amino acid ABC transporter substrate-binding protein n=1 Tax=Mesorhizobium sp. TaxID=1871066 RepID=UPI000FE77E2C|nr:branched-chain amino acid ABC transporter substrate-binding protein [Mesorhizobium sp.]RWC46228.1 MAG: hypothetical protein EOS28_03175 [Mesorhizobium sp.]RWF04126.1 MAG: hypothetical protein EOS68_02710 [Mesorhizobium sp.]